jgi:hypothetical protein
MLLKAGIMALLANEIRGIVLAGPALYGLYRTGGTWMAVWLGFCALTGIALSVAAPLFVASRFKLIRVGINLQI